MCYCIHCGSKPIPIRVTLVEARLQLSAYDYEIPLAPVTAALLSSEASFVAL